MTSRIVVPLVALISVVLGGCGAVADVLAARSDPADFFTTPTAHLLDAARGGDEAQVRSLIAGGADINEVSDRGRRVGITPVQWAVEFDRPTTVTTLLRVSADPHRVGTGGYNAVAYALMRDRPQALAAMLAADPSLVDASDRLGGTVMHTAVRHRRDDGLALLLEYGGNVDSIQPLAGRTPLFTAAGVLNIDHCLVLLRAGADGGHRDQTGRTFLPALYRGDDSIRSASFLRTRTQIETEMRTRGYPLDTEP